MRTNGRVLTTGCLAIERLKTNRRVFLPWPLTETVAEHGVGVAKQRPETNGRVVGPGGVAYEGKSASGCIVATCGVVVERAKPISRVLEPSC